MRALGVYVLFVACGNAVGQANNPFKIEGPPPDFLIVGEVDAKTITFVKIRDGSVYTRSPARIKDLVVQTAAGRILRQSDWLPLMTPGKVVVLSSDEQAIDGAYTRILKPDTLVIRNLRKPSSSDMVLYRPSPGQGGDAGKVIFKWSASGSDLEARSVSLSYAENVNGPWLLIAGGLEHKSSFAWRPPKQFPLGVFLRLESKEEDGDVLRAQTPERIPLDPGTRTPR
jgi:hypothetical protein